MCPNYLSTFVFSASTSFTHSYTVEPRSRVPSKTSHIIRNFTPTVASSISVIMPGAALS